MQAMMAPKDESKSSPERSSANVRAATVMKYRKMKARIDAATRSGTGLPPQRLAGQHQSAEHLDAAADRARAAEDAGEEQHPDGREYRPARVVLGHESRRRRERHDIECRMSQRREKIRILAVCREEDRDSDHDQAEQQEYRNGLGMREIGLQRQAPQLRKMTGEVERCGDHDDDQHELDRRGIEIRDVRVVS